MHYDNKKIVSNNLYSTDARAIEMDCLLVVAACFKMLTGKIAKWMHV